jgi:hypothetical protein
MSTSASATLQWAVRPAGKRLIARATASRRIPVSRPDLRRHDVRELYVRLLEEQQRISGGVPGV